MQPERTQIYGNWRVAEAVAAPKSPARHKFGGTLTFEETREDCGFPIHLLYDLDLSDPLIDIKIPNVKRLPLIYCFSYENQRMEVGYQIVSETQLTFYFNPDERIELSSDERFPMKDFPTSFPTIPVELKSTQFNPSNPEDAGKYFNVFGISKLSPNDQQAFLDGFLAWWNQFAPEPWTGTMEELLEYHSGPTVQQHPASRCPNPKCRNHNQRRKMNIFALIPSDPHPGISLWGKGGRGTQIVFEICPECSSIVASNQCD